MMMLRALVLTVALGPVARAECEVCTKDVYLKVESCGAFWTPSKYVGEWAEGVKSDAAGAFWGRDGGCHKDICCAKDSDGCLVSTQTKGWDVIRQGSQNRSLQRDNGGVVLT